MKILMTGATGLIGQELGIALVREGHELVVISRRGEEATRELPFPCEIIKGDLEAGPVSDARLAGVEGVVHLAGEPVASSRWNDEKKKRILDSRVLGTRHLRQSFESLKNSKLRVLVSASAVGFYGDRGDEVLTEKSEVGGDFLARVCREWENEVHDWSKAHAGLRTVVLRTGIVLCGWGGALPKMLPPFRVGLGGALGDGQAWMPWIHLEDMINMYRWAFTETKVSGIYNAVAPEEVRNRDFSRRLAEAFGQRLGPSVPKLALKLALGEMSRVLLASQRVQPVRAVEHGFQFRYPQLIEALAEVAKLFDGAQMIKFARQYLPQKPNEVFPFFAEAKNLERITPETLQFHITKVSTPAIEEGTLIDYRLKIHGVPVHWRTRIEQWKPGREFVDTQLQGPYRRWHHTHHFEALGTGTLMTDVVRFDLPLGWLGWGAAGWWVRRDVDQIFRHRRQVCSDPALFSATMKG